MLLWSRRRFAALPTTRSLHDVGEIKNRWFVVASQRLRRILRWIFLSVALGLLVVSYRLSRNIQPYNNNSNQKPIWKWSRYHRWYSTRPSLLIGHYTSQDEADNYRVMMKTSAQAISRAYCRRWRCDVVTLEGTLFKHPTHNKVGLVETAFWRGYQRLLLLDADCILVNHTVDVTRLIPNNKMVMAHHIWGNITREPWNTNVGVTLWNLRHPWLLYFAWRWRKRCETDTMNNDQWHYHILIQGKEGEWKGFEQAQLATTEDYFQYEKGSVVKHFKREEGDVWGQPSQDRIDNIRQQVALVCQNNTFC